ncbi:MAG: glycosyltransferase [Sedimentibacter saalensis]|uniref:glycosyltransferase n=1 Tax=Sedimentibacter saalensis TaxID=130788 RepID=UPI003158474F
MKIMIFDVPAENGGGALTILKHYYEKAIEDKKNTYYFVISTPNLYETKNIIVLRYPWVKKSWFHRLVFDFFIAYKLVEKYKIEKVISLQNLIIPKVKIKQVLYLHQPLPFSEKRYKIKENFKFWLYQNVISKMIFYSINKADKVIVQTEWMKKACKSYTSISDKIIVEQPKLNITIKKTYKKGNDKNKIFFYPASSYIYKNHNIIVEAVELLEKYDIKSYRVIFTLSGNENNHINKLYQEIKNKNLPIDFVGKIPIEEVYDYYSKAILIFPSYIETFGLPMLEAKMHGCPIIASDCAFSHEVLDSYYNVKFFNPSNGKELFEQMKNICLDVCLEKRDEIYEEYK